MRPYRTAIAAAIALAMASPTLADAPFVDSKTISQVQQTLQHRGFHVGRSDGIMGPRTQIAVKRFQESENLEPSGQLNRQTLAALGIGDEDAAGEPPDRFTTATIREVQKTLNNRGFRAGAASGVMNSDTRTAIKDFQESENLEQTGHLNRQTLTALGIDAEPAAAGERVVPRAQRESVRRVQQALNDHGFRAGPADGIMGQATRAALREFQRAEHLAATGRLNRQTLEALGIAEPTHVARIGTERAASVRRVQLALRDRGYDPGPVDGVMGRQTVMALREFQRSEQLAATGQLNRQTLEELGVG